MTPSSAVFWTGLSELSGLIPFAHDSNLTCNRGTCPAPWGSASEIPELCPSRKGPAEGEEGTQGWVQVKSNYNKKFYIMFTVCKALFQAFYLYHSI